jgi:hypothetical protein
MRAEAHRCAQLVVVEGLAALARRLRFEVRAVTSQ